MLASAAAVARLPTGLFSPSVYGWKTKAPAEESKENVMFFKGRSFVPVRPKSMQNSK